MTGIWSMVDGPAIRPASWVAHGRQCSGGQLATGSRPLDAVRRRRSSGGLGLAHRRSLAPNRRRPAATLGSASELARRRRFGGPAVKGAGGLLSARPREVHRGASLFGGRLGARVRAAVGGGAQLPGDGATQRWWRC
jgi:hypothetical protein